MYNDSEIAQLIHLWINPIISLIGCVSCVASFLVFSRSIFIERYFIHIRIEILAMLIDLIITCGQPLYYAYVAREFEPIPIYSYCYYKYLVIYGKSIFELVALYSNILTNITFITYVYSKTPKSEDRADAKCCKKHSGLFLTILIVIGCAVLYSYMLLKYEIRGNNNANQTLDNWNITENKEIHYLYLELGIMGIRDGVGMMLLLGTNIILLWKVKRLMKEKMELFNRQAHQNTNVHSHIYSTRNRMTLAIYFNSLKCLIGRLPILSYYLVKNLNDLCFLEVSKSMMEIYFALGGMCIYITYAISFFTFYHGNSLFRKIVHGKLGKATPIVRIHPESHVANDQRLSSRRTEFDKPSSRIITLKY